YPVTFFCESEEQPVSKSNQTNQREVFAKGEVIIRMLTQSRFCSLPTELVNPNCAFGFGFLCLQIKHLMSRLPARQGIRSSLGEGEFFRFSHSQISAILRDTKWPGRD